MDYYRIDKINDATVFATLESAVINGRILKFKVLCPKGDAFMWTELLIGYSYKIEEDREDYIVRPDSIRDAGFGVEMTCAVDLEEFPFKPTNWTVQAVYEKNGEKYAARIQNPSKKIRAGELLKGGYSYVDSTGHLVFTCSTRGAYFGLRYREKTEYDGIQTKIKEVIALRKYSRKKEYYRKKQIYLIYEKQCAKAQDNGYYLFKYCMDNGMEKYLGRSIYYVIKKDSPDIKKLEPYKDNIIIFGSIQHMIFQMAAKLLLSSDSKAHGYIWQYDRSLIGQRMGSKKFVFLGHGVLALKKLNESFLASRMNAVLTTVTSDNEADIVADELGYKKNAAVVTGYARFDGLKDASEDYREILIMPTHRSWVFGVDRKTFVNSEYYKRYMDLINSPEFIAMLRENDLTANFYLHPSINEHFDAFKSSDERVRLIPMGSESLDDLMMRCKLLITDYSSVCWDLYYMGKPVIFYQYDIAEYMETWGSYIDLEKETPGNRAGDLDQLLTFIKESISLDFRMDDYWQSRREDHFRFIDRENCRRITEVLKERNL